MLAALRCGQWCHSYARSRPALELGPPEGTRACMRTGLIAVIASLSLAACGGDETKTNATNDENPQSTPTVAK